ncbi:MAG TPA: deoxyhypusine synthase [Nitrososphaerales archaeon]|nr:deoxyhypusine synthase [Nitrososphaerales archaeon]
MKRSIALEKVRDVHAPRSDDIVDLVDQMGKGGGFTAKSLSEAAVILRDMGADQDCTKFMSFPAAPVATGLRGVLIDLVRGGLVDAIVTASGTLDHDIARTLACYYHGRFELDDVELLRKGYHRLGNVLVPLESYGPLIEKRMQALLSRLYRSGTRSITSEALCSEIGKDLGSKDSLLYWAQKKEVPVFVPGIMDGAVGSQIWLFAESHRDFTVDVIGDERRLSDIVNESRRTGALVIGGGISKHHVLWWNQFRGGLDYACYITTAQEFDGSLSGAQVREAVSWGKVKPKAAQVTLYGEATTVLPLIASYALTSLGRKRPA